ncbi:hypothetical protein CYCME_0569 [Cycloclasticus zancles 78-ME]|uniref:Uncharacterized protein n=1 Tax=Cycloclasticus zancles 78-ME TaxID=1198232 RepID=S5TV04_9GAMM|nr:hypothetical protein CYCME_0569 [Cycloclasticus zancles 78-ME]
MDLEIKVMDSGISCINHRQQVVDKLNYRPGKCLNFRTPYEVFFKIKTVHLECEFNYTHALFQKMARLTYKKVTSLEVPVC